MMLRIIIALILLNSVAFADTGLVFPSNDGTSVQFRFTGANLVDAWPTTIIWRIKPTQQSGYYTTYFWGNMAVDDDMSDFQYNYYGTHPYPKSPPSGNTHYWEVSIDAEDDTTDENSHDTTVVYDQWFIQAAVITESSNDVTVRFYWDLPDTTKYIEHTATNYALNFPPDHPGLCFGDATWNPTNELLSGTIRGIQIYSTNLSQADMVTESANDSSNTPQTASGISNVWYMNQNPTPTDISDKSGEGHDPAWYGASRPTLYEYNSGNIFRNVSLRNAVVN